MSPLKVVFPSSADQDVQRYKEDILLEGDETRYFDLYESVCKLPADQKRQAKDTWTASAI